MTKKILGIGGGGNGRIKPDGTQEPYETEVMDQEIVKLSGKENPHFLFLAHSQTLENQEPYFIQMKSIFGDKFHCECKDIKSDELADLNYVQSLVDWADIIYEGGGNTLDMIALWKETGFDKILYEAWNTGKVMCGRSAGANCWFEQCSSDSLQIKYGPDQPLIAMECLGFLPGLFVPHCDEPGRYDSVKEILKEKDMIAIQLSNCTAIEIIDNTYRIIVGNPADKAFIPYALRTYWKDGQYIEVPIEVTEEYRNIDELYEK